MLFVRTKLEIIELNIDTIYIDSIMVYIIVDYMLKKLSHLFFLFSNRYFFLIKI